MHPYCLSLFGMSLGELWDLRRLAAYCREKGRYSFMLTSSPLDVPCLVGSPPSALAIFKSKMSRVERATMLLVLCAGDLS